MRTLVTGLLAVAALVLAVAVAVATLDSVRNGQSTGLLSPSAGAASTSPSTTPAIVTDAATTPSTPGPSETGLAAPTPAPSPRSSPTPIAPSDRASVAVSPPPDASSHDVESPPTDSPTDRPDDPGEVPMTIDGSMDAAAARQLGEQAWAALDDDLSASGQRTWSAWDLHAIRVDATGDEPEVVLTWWATRAVDEGRDLRHTVWPWATQPVALPTTFLPATDSARGQRPARRPRAREMTTAKP